MTDDEFTDLVYRVRNAQRRYFRDKTRAALDAARALERQLDTEILARAVAPRQSALPLGSLAPGTAERQISQSPWIDAAIRCPDDLSPVLAVVRPSFDTYGYPWLAIAWHDASGRWFTHLGPVSGIVLSWRPLPEIPPALFRWYKHTESDETLVPSGE
jgi:hypothetical protein